MKPSDLEDEGFDPRSVGFTKKFLNMQQYNVDHWAISKDKVLLHWGAIPETQQEWQDLHAEAEKIASDQTGTCRNKLYKCTDDQRKEWRAAFDSHVRKHLASKASGWFASEEDAAAILIKALKYE
jgi:hypothetical protein